MPLYNINTVNASLQLTAAAAIDYSTVLIVDCNHLTTDRTTVYTSVDGYSSVVPSGTPLRKMLDSAFSSSAAPAKVVVGRAKGDAIVTPADAIESDTYSFTIEVKDGYSLSVSHTTASLEDQEDIATAWKALIDGDSNISDHVDATVTGTGVDASLTLTLVDSDSDDFALSDETDNVSYVSVISESPADSISGIREVNTDWTYIVATDHSPTYQDAMAVVATIYQKLYVTSTALEEAYQAWDGTSTPDANNIPAVFRFNQYNFAHCVYSHQADEYPEAVRITEFTDVKPGKDDFQYKNLAGFQLAQIADGSRALNGNELYNLQNTYASTFISLGGVTVIGGNRVASGVRIEAIAVLNYFRQELQRKADTLMLRMRKLGINDNDIGLLRNVWATFLSSNVSVSGNTQALDPYKPYVITLPKAADYSFEERAEGTITGSVVCYLDASIDSTVLNMTLTYRDPAEG